MELICGLCRLGIGGFIFHGFGEGDSVPKQIVSVNEGENVVDATTGQTYTSYSVSYEVSTVPRRYSDFGYVTRVRLVAEVRLCADTLQTYTLCAP